MPAPTASAPAQQMRDSFMSNSGNSGLSSSRGPVHRPPTPFNPALSVPATPPEIFLVTRPDTHIPQSMWENFQPNQLFPDDSGLSYFSPPSSTSTLDPQLQGVSATMDPTTMRPTAMHHDGNSSSGKWDGYDGMHDGGHEMSSGGLAGSSPDDTWSNSSKGGIVPSTLNVEDW